ncbi:MAG: hypothetical protein Q4D45_00695 [Lachnospiraceae bacterium]|nr:hypothetical protein [Lachnospiraceae bacterium]
MKKSRLVITYCLVISWGLILGYMTAIRSELSIFWLWILDNG